MVIHQHFGKDAAGRVAGAKEKDVVNGFLIHGGGFPGEGFNRDKRLGIERRQVAAVFGQVRHQFDNHVATGLIDQLPALAAAIEQASLLQGFQVERQCRQRQAETLPYLAGGLRSGLGQMAKNIQPGVLRERAEYGDSG